MVKSDNRYCNILSFKYKLEGTDVEVIAFLQKVLIAFLAYNIEWYGSGYIPTTLDFTIEPLKH